MCIALGRLPSELEQTLTLEDFNFFVKCSAVEPFPSSKIDIAQAYIRRDLKCVMSGNMPEDIVMEWNKAEPIDLKELPVEEQAKQAIKMLNAMSTATGGMPDKLKADSIKRINEKCQTFQSENLEQ